MSHCRYNQQAVENTVRSYDVLGEVGRGGMASVSVARFEAGSGIHMPVVVKRMLPGLDDSVERQKMFIDEAKTLALIHHPNVVRVIEVGSDQHNRPYIVFEYLHGETLDVLLKAAQTSGSLHWRLAGHIVAEVCGGLHAAHETRGVNGEPLNLVHRDISPHNIFIGFDGWVRLIDFGIAHTNQRSTETREGILKGKIRYMSPEQCLQKELSRASDIFSAGIVLYELLTGKLPFDAQSDFEVMKKICQDLPPDPSELNPSVPESMADICLCALEPKPDGRFKNADEMRLALLKALDEQSEQSTAALGPELASTMQTLLPKRYQEKQSLLQDIRSGESVNVGRALHPEEKTIITVSTEIGGPTRRRFAFAWVAVATIVLGGLGAWVLTSESQPRASTEPPSDALISNAAPVLLDKPARRAREDVVENGNESATAVVHIVSVPPGATATLGDKSLGETPVRTELPVSDHPQTLALSLDGYTVYRQELTVERDMSVHTTLVEQTPKATTQRVAKRRATKRRPTKRPTKTAKTSQEPLFPMFR